MYITSLDNKLIKHAASLKNKKYRELSGEFLAEGLRNVIELIKHDHAGVKSVFVTERQRDRFLDAALTAGALKQFLDETVYTVPENLIKKICDTEESQEVVAVAAQKKEFKLDDAEGDNGTRNSSYYLYLDKIRDPGNLGAILRTAAATGFRVLLYDCADVYSPKVVRAGMGAALLADFANAEEDTLCRLKEKGYLILAADMNGENMYRFKPVEKVCIVIGGEADGISQSVLSKCDQIVSIPMQRIESLNAAVAAAVLMYQFKRDF